MCLSRNFGPDSPGTGSKSNPSPLMCLHYHASAWNSPVHLSVHQTAFPIQEVWTDSLKLTTAESETWIHIGFPTVTLDWLQMWSGCHGDGDDPFLHGAYPHFISDLELCTSRFVSVWILEKQGSHPAISKKENTNHSVRHFSGQLSSWNCLWFSHGGGGDKWMHQTCLHQAIDRVL